MTMQLAGNCARKLCGQEYSSDQLAGNCAWKLCAQIEKSLIHTCYYNKQHTILHNKQFFYSCVFIFVFILGQLGWAFL